MNEPVELPISEPIDPKLGQQLHDILLHSVELEEGFQSQHRLPVHQQSRLRCDQRIGNAASGFNTASISLAASLDHLRTWYQVIAGISKFPLPILSHYTLARAAYEPALLTLWVLDSDVDSQTRIGRGYASQLRSLEDMRKFQQAVGMTGEDANATTLYKRLFEAARQEGYVITRADGSEGLKVAVPSMVTLFNAYDSGAPGAGMPEWLYRFLSGYTHGREWATLRGAIEADLEGFDTGMNMIRADVPALCYLAGKTVKVVDRAVAAHIRYRTEVVA